MRTVLSKFVIAVLVASGMTLVTVAPAQASCPFSTNGDTAGSAYLITTEAELGEITSCFSSGKKYFKLGNNIRLTQKWDTVDLVLREMHLDGDNFEISGLEMEASSGDLAMFENGEGSIKNLSIRGGEIENTGSDYTAVLVSQTQDSYEIDNVHIVMDKISGGNTLGGFVAEDNEASSSITNSSIKVLNGIHASTGTRKIGGAAGSFAGTIQNVQVIADIDGKDFTSTNQYIGGVLGETYDSGTTTSVLDSHYEGSIVGSGSDSTIGGLVGYREGATGKKLFVERSSARADLSSAKYIGGILGNAQGGTTQTFIRNNKFIGTLDSGIASDSYMAGAIVLPDTTINHSVLERNLVQASFNGSGGTAASMYVLRLDNSAAPDPLSQNVYDSELLGQYDGNNIPQATAIFYNDFADADAAKIVGKTSAELQDKVNYPWNSASEIKPASTTPDSAGGDIWGICDHADPAAAAAAGFETTAFLLTEVRRCASLPAITMDIASSQTVVEGNAITPVYPNNTSVTNLESMRTSYYSVSPELPAGLSIHSRTGRISGTPDSVDSTIYTLTATNGVSTQTTTFSLLPDPNSGSTPAPAPYTGPLVTSVGAEQTAGAFQTTSAATVTVYGERLSGVNKVFIEGKEAVITSTSNDSFVMTLPEGLTDGVHDLVIQSSLGNLTYLDAFVITQSAASNEVAANCDGQSMSYWTKRISDTQAKVYIKCPELGQKYRILQQTGGSGEYDVPFVKTINSLDDSSLVVNEFGTYIVRTIELEEINRIRISVDSEDVWKVRYNN